MKKLSLILAVLVLVSNFTFAQFKEIPRETKTKLKSGNGLILGFINPKNFSLTHSFNMSYGSYGNASVGLASYTATLAYQVLKNMNISADVTMQYSPYAQISSNPAINKDFQNSFNGINLSRVSFNYRPLKNMFISIDYVNTKNNNLYWYDNYYRNHYWDDSH
jgi:hypothetical protein